MKTLSLLLFTLLPLTGHAELNVIADLAVKMLRRILRPLINSPACPASVTYSLHASRTTVFRWLTGWRVCYPLTHLN